MTEARTPAKRAPRKAAPKKAAPKPPPPRLKIEVRAVADLLNDPANARKHSQRTLIAIRASLRRFDIQKPIVVDKQGVVIAGNGTLLAAADEGWEWIEVVVSTLSPAEARGYGLADNRTAELAEWDMDVLPDVLRSLGTDLQFDVGWDPDELDKLMAEVDGDPHDSGEHDNYEGRWEVVVECKDEEDQQKVYDALTAEGRTCRTLTL
jgi:ParB-like chromosome segregation protein Spo0J